MVCAHLDQIQDVVETLRLRDPAVLVGSFDRPNLFYRVRRRSQVFKQVQEVLARFPGARVVEVRKLAPEPPDSDASGEDPAEGSDGDDQ